jgi:excisionase family DNA binding protein
MRKRGDRSCPLRSEADGLPVHGQLTLPLAPPAPLRSRPAVAEPLTVRVPDAIRMTGIGRTKLYALIGSGEITALKVGRCTLITVDSLHELLARAAG